MSQQSEDFLVKSIAAISLLKEAIKHQLQLRLLTPIVFLLKKEGHLCLNQFYKLRQIDLIFP